MSERVDLLDGRVTLYRGDCREILMTLGKVDDAGLIVHGQKGSHFRYFSI